MANSNCISRSSKSIRKLFERGALVCDHPKPAFSTGRLRLFCFECVPKESNGGPRKQYQLKNPQARNCPQCGNRFAAGAYGQRFCSRRCGNKFNNIRRQVLARDRSARECKFCKSEFTPSYGDLRRDYCSDECQKKARYRKKSGSTHRRRAREHGCAYEDFSKWEIFERDGWRCGICGVSTPRSLSGKQNDRSPQLDHILPLSRGGGHTRSNVQCCCRRCNMEKGARPLGQFRLF